MIDSLINSVSWLIDLLIVWVPRVLLYWLAFILIGMGYSLLTIGRLFPRRYKPKKKGPR